MKKVLRNDTLDIYSICNENYDKKVLSNDTIDRSREKKGGDISQRKESSGQRPEVRQKCSRRQSDQHSRD